jgi:hypothetical protein
MQKAEVIFSSEELKVGPQESYFLFDDGNVAEIGASVGAILNRRERSGTEFEVEDISEAARLKLQNLGATVNLLDQ